MSADVYLILVTKEGIVREHWWIGGSSMAYQLSKYLSKVNKPEAEGITTYVDTKDKVLRMLSVSENEGFRYIDTPQQEDIEKLDPNKELVWNVIAIW